MWPFSAGGRLNLSCSPSLDHPAGGFSGLWFRGAIAPLNRKAPQSAVCCRSHEPLRIQSTKRSWRMGRRLGDQRGLGICVDWLRRRCIRRCRLGHFRGGYVLGQEIKQPLRVLRKGRAPEWCSAFDFAYACPLSAKRGPNSLCLVALLQEG